MIIPPTPAQPATPAALGYLSSGQAPAPLPAGLDGWINSAPLGIDDLRGKIVLLDFWTYTCVNCIRTLPFLQEWHRKYADKGLLIIGVHTPEFDFERIYENVAAAAVELGIEYPVAQDNDYITWRAYRVEAWPSKYIVDGSGFVRYFHRGEGGYAESEEVIRYLLEEMGEDVSDIEADTFQGQIPLAGFRSSDLETFLTREIYGGARRNIDFGGAYILNEEYYAESGVEREYTDPGEWRNHFLALQGSWLNGPESLRHTRTTPGYEDYIGLKFFANEVNAVMNVETGAEYQFRVMMDGNPVPSDAAGEDITYDENGDSIVAVNSPRMYRLIRKQEVSSHELVLSPKDDRFSLYALTFGAYPQRE